jgi:hypothetical protein
VDYVRSDEDGVAWTEGDAAVRGEHADLLSPNERALLRELEREARCCARSARS